MTASAAYKKTTELSEVLDWLRARLDAEEREHLALELLDVTRKGDDYEHVLGSWVLMVLTREHPDYAWQLKEFRNLETSGELFEGTSLSREALAETPRRALELSA